MTYKIHPTSDREIITKLAREAKGGLLTVLQASRALDMSTKKTTFVLAALFRKGWLLRPKRGLYFILPLEATPGKAMVSEDPWIVAKALFSPGYIGGWSAAEFWELTEQIFRSTLIVTANNNIRTKEVNVLGHLFRIFKIKTMSEEGLSSVWRGSEQILVSDKERTFIDCFRTPELCGGVHQLGLMMAAYRSNKEHDFSLLIMRAKAMANGAAWKRLGYMAEVYWPEAKALIAEAQKNIRKGNSKLDPNIASKGHLVKKWRLWVNLTLNQADAS